MMRIAEVGQSDTRRFYHLTDAQFSTVAVLGLGGTYAPLHERVSYDPNGRATHAGRAMSTMTARPTRTTAT